MVGVLVSLVAVHVEATPKKLLWIFPSSSDHCLTDYNQKAKSKGR